MAADLFGETGGVADGGGRVAAAVLLAAAFDVAVEAGAVSERSMAEARELASSEVGDGLGDLLQVWEHQARTLAAWLRQLGAPADTGTLFTFAPIGVPDRLHPYLLTLGDVLDGRVPRGLDITEPDALAEALVTASVSLGAALADATGAALPAVAEQLPGYQPGPIPRRPDLPDALIGSVADHHSALAQQLGGLVEEGSLLVPIVGQLDGWYRGVDGPDAPYPAEGPLAAFSVRAGSQIDLGAVWPAVEVVLSDSTDAFAVRPQPVPGEASALVTQLAMRGRDGQLPVTAAAALHTSMPPTATAATLAARPPDVLLLAVGMSVCVLEVTTDRSGTSALAELAIGQLKRLAGPAIVGAFHQATRA